MRFDEYSSQDWEEEKGYPYSHYYQTGGSAGPSSGGGKRPGGWIGGLAVLVLLVVGAAAVFRGDLDRWFPLETGDPDGQSQDEEPAPDTAQKPSDQEDAKTEPQRPSGQGSGTTLEIKDLAPSEPTMPDGGTGSLSLQQIYKKVLPSVVTVIANAGSGTSTGTGIIMSQDGYVITNEHVIDAGGELTVLLSTDETCQAVLVGSDEASDLAVLKIEKQSLTPAEFGDSDQLQVGDAVVAIGNPLGIQLRGTMTNGIVSAINRDLTINNRTMTLIQTNAALNSGNSGGPLINSSGQVVGITALKLSSYYAASVEGLGFAIPISSAKPIVDELIEKGYVSGRPALGISGEHLPAAVRAYWRLPDGIYISEVDPDSDAWAKGIQPGDIILAINGTQVTTVDQLEVVKNQYAAGDTVTLRIYRGGEQFDVDIQLIDKAQHQEN